MNLPPSTEGVLYCGVGGIGVDENSREERQPVFWLEVLNLQDHPDALRHFGEIAGVLALYQ